MNQAGAPEADSDQLLPDQEIHVKTDKDSWRDPLPLSVAADQEIESAASFSEGANGDNSEPGYLTEGCLYKGTNPIDPHFVVRFPSFLFDIYFSDHILQSRSPDTNSVYSPVVQE